MHDNNSAQKLKHHMCSTDGVIHDQRRCRHFQENMRSATAQKRLDLHHRALALITRLLQYNRQPRCGIVNGKISGSQSAKDTRPVMQCHLMPSAHAASSITKSPVQRPSAGRRMP
ncbi:hypothetical protein VFPPC_18695 [Pochonia chlamydosporia 170]|uniref:Uncharacterized protein n=1 Tax=Pochonia chlamydosporia 170 TaxID=1380566 RepID=A0A219AS37_METCM|nr:hypothetical protein VFPPC_18695 [Pochonia chlamydosporia 170]OWT43578.1 hypothetical protein VFPPC_18695 [Pochonia chlamydosporia 170]